MTKSLGKLPSGDRLDRIKTSPNYKNGTFRNLSETKMMADDASYVDMAFKFFGKGIDRAPLRPLPSINTALHHINEEYPTIIWFGHSTYLLRINSINILVDPVFSERASPFQSIGTKRFPLTHDYTPSDMPEIDVLLITHDHYDHLDYHTISLLRPRVRQICTTLGVGAHLNYWGFDSKIIREFDWWEGHEVLSGITLTAAPARHFSGRSFSRNKTLWSSFIIKTINHTLFLGGDSGYDKTMFMEIGSRLGPFDIAILECGQYNTMWPSIHMMPEETVQASIDLRASVLLPVHWGRFALALHPWYDPIERVTASAVKSHVTITTPLIGQPVSLGKPLPGDYWWKSVM